MIYLIVKFNKINKKAGYKNDYHHQCQEHQNDLHLKPWSCCEEINGKWLQTAAASELKGGKVVQVTKAERSQSLQPRQGGQLEYDEIGYDKFGKLTS